MPYEEWEVLCRAKALVELAARRAGAAPLEASVVRRTLLPLGVGVLRQFLESPRVKEKLDEVAVLMLRALVPNGSAARRRSPERKGTS